MCLSVCLLTLKVLANECTRISAVVKNPRCRVVSNRAIQPKFVYSCWDKKILAIVER